jgi:hypothetical protein
MMKKIRFIFVLLFIFTAASLLPATSLAGHEDFDITYTVSPTLAGFKGADITLRITVENKGSTNITWLDVGVTTVTPYSQHWAGTILPGYSNRRTILFTVPFGYEDFNCDKLLSVAMNNDSDPGSDGTQVRTFSVAGTWDIFEKGWSITPDRAVYDVGDTVTITHTFRNTFTENAATDFKARGHLTLNGDHIYQDTYDDHGVVMPGETVSTSFDYTFSDDDVGHMQASYQCEYDMMGENYQEAQWSAEFNVAAPEPDIDFITHLDADPMTIDSGETVYFSVGLENRGDDIDRFEIRNAEGGMVAETEAMPSGGWDSVPLTTEIYESADVSYVVIAYVGDDSLSKETNTLHITVREPEESASPSPSDEDSAAPTVSGPAPSSSELQSADPVSPEACESAAEADVPAQTQGDNFILYIIIGVLGAIVVTGIIIAMLLLRNKRHRE